MIIHSAKNLIVSTVSIVLLLAQVQAAAEQTNSVERLRQARGFFALPLEFDFDSGAENGNASILRVMPLYTFPVYEQWKLVNLSIITLADAPGGTPAFPGDNSSGQTAGLSDLLHASFVTPTRSGDFIWGVGPIFSFPTATAPTLGSGKWAAGPAFRFTYRKGPWNLGVIAGQRWSFAGSDNRADVNQLLIRGAVRRQLPNDWFFVYAPLITVNWDSPGQKWLVPVGGGIGRSFKINTHPWAWSVQAYYNAIKPEPAPDLVFRFAIIAAIPFGED